MGTTPEWELSKENAAPLQRGRNVAALERATLQKRDDKKSRVDEFEKLVRPSEAPFVTKMECDPIVDWLAYIKYYQEYYPSDTNDQFLLMERCTRALVKMPQYADDDRFLAVCAKYADKTKDPGQVFKFLHQQKVGQKTALFWCAWAFVAEKANDFPFAEQVYKKAIAKNAQPVTLIQQRHQQFQRRMSRHWLNSSQANDCLDDDDEEEATKRGALSGLSRQGASRNHRPISNRRAHDQASRTTLASRHNNNEEAGGAFPIFVEQNGENTENGYNLDQSFLGIDKRELVKDADRKKENTQDAERWNASGGIRSIHAHRSGSRPAPPPSSGPPPPFAVFVDEECAAQHEQQAEDQRKQVDRRRYERDERTFRERKDEGMAEKLAKEPLRYVLDPSQLETDQEERKDASQKDDKHIQLVRKTRCGFDKRLLMDANGEEQSFEEARARGRSYKIESVDSNFNHLHVARSQALGDSQMDIDEDLSFIEGGSTAELATPRSGVAFVAEELPPRKITRLSSIKKARGIGSARPDASFESGLNQTGISTASSTLNEGLAVGLLTTREEQTINTKFALKELSMMFSSPAFGADDAVRKTRQSHATGIGGDGIDAEVDFTTNMAELVGNMTLDNSILGPDLVNEENNGPRNPSARTTDSPNFEKMALRQLDGEVEPSFDLGCQRQGVVNRPLAQHDPLRGPEVEFSDDPGFKIFEDEEMKPAATSAAMFQIFQDVDSATSEIDDTTDAGAAVLPQASVARSGFTIYQGGNDSVTDETATLSLVGEVFDGIDDGVASSNSLKGGAFSIFVDQSDADDNTDCRDPVVLEGMLTAGISKIKNCKSEGRNVSKLMTEVPMEIANQFDYGVTHENDIMRALLWVDNLPYVAPKSRASMASMLSAQGGVQRLPHQILPKEFRQKRQLKRTVIHMGQHSGEVTNELGRGSYGVVVLMDVGGGSRAVAAKAQSPTGSLAWEYQILRALEERVGRQQVESYPFPRPYSCLFLADGAILSMTAASNSGLNLVGLVNAYKRTGNGVPEIIALHYTSRMLKHVEQLHSQGKVLHCDVKPDNFVLSKSDDSDNLCKGLKGAELSLVDFGRAIDLTNFTTGTKTKLSGEATGKDMRCIAMRTGQPWSFDIDTFGILCSAHVLLFGIHMEIAEGKDHQWKPRCTFPRYWQRELWAKVFNQLLTAEGSRGESLRKLRERVDEHLSLRKTELLEAIRRQATTLLDSREKI